MRYLRCKCGKHTAWSSMGSPPCAGCDECNTTLAEGPDGHQTPEPHVPVEETVTTTRNGETRTTARRYCERCMKSLTYDSLSGDTVQRSLAEMESNRARAIQELNALKSEINALQDVYQ